MVDTNSDVKPIGLAISLQRLFNPLVEAATMRMQDPQSDHIPLPVENINVS